MTSFKVWLEASGDVTSSRVGYSPNSSQLSFAVDEPPPVTSPSLPWQMNIFRGWYNFHRGRWSDVEKAARSNPQVLQFLKQAASRLVADPNHLPSSTPQNQNPYDEPEFDLDGKSVMGDLGDQLEALVKKEVPEHGYRDPGSWAVPAQYRAPGSSIPAASPKPAVDDKTQVQGAIRHLWNRQDALEDKVNQIGQKVGVTTVA